MNHEQTTKASDEAKTTDNGKVLLSEFPFSIEIIRKKFPVSSDIQETESNLMKNNYDRLLLKKKNYNEYCLIEVHKGTQQLGFTIFKSDWNTFSQIESDFKEGLSFAPNDKSEVYVIINALV